MPALPPMTSAIVPSSLTLRVAAKARDEKVEALISKATAAQIRTPDDPSSQDRV
jgi:hypothetical protein